MPYKDIAPPAGEKITRTDRLNVPDRPIIPFIRGDGTGPDIWAASERVFDAAVEKAYGGKKKVTPGSIIPPTVRKRKRSSIFSKKNFRRNSTRSDSVQKKKRRSSGNEWAPLKKAMCWLVSD